MNENLDLKISTTISESSLKYLRPRPDYNPDVVVGLCLCLMTIASLHLYRRLKKMISMELSNYMWSDLYSSWRCRYSLRPDIK